MKQCTGLIAKENFYITPHEGRKICIKIGDKFVVTNPEYRHSVDGIKIARSKTAKLNMGHLISIENILKYFTVEE